jgi:hypothetical protein
VLANRAASRRHMVRRGGQALAYGAQRPSYPPATRRGAAQRIGQLEGELR